jgi:hypothetical protein
VEQALVKSALLVQCVKTLGKHLKYVKKATLHLLELLSVLRARQELNALMVLRPSAQIMKFLTQMLLLVL